MNNNTQPFHKLPHANECTDRNLYFGQARLIRFHYEIIGGRLSYERILCLILSCIENLRMSPSELGVK